MTVALYCRVSTEEQAKEGFSLEAQQEVLKAYCAYHGWADYEYYVEDGYSGKDLERPALQRLIRHVKQGHIEHVVIWRLDRISRSQKDTLFLVEDVFDKHGVGFHSTRESFDTTTPVGKMMLGILSTFAQFERESLIERVKLGRRQRIRRGLWHGGRIPFGYEWDKDAQELRVVPEQAELVKEVYKRYLHGRSLSEIADWIAERTSDRKASHVLIRDLLDRPLYSGNLLTGTGDISPGRHEAIVPEEMWRKVQRERERRREGMTPAGSYLLSGICVCGLCGGSIIHIPRHSKGYTYQLYCCKNQHVRSRERRGQPHCRLGYKRQEKLESEIVRQLRKAAITPISVVESIQANIDISNTDYLRDELEQSMQEISSKLDRWYDAFEEGVLAPQQLKDRIANLESEKKKIQLRIDELDDKQRPPKTDELFDALHLIEESWDDMTFDEQQLVLRAAVERIILYPDRSPEFVWNV